jgi:hypothetical protein
VLDSKELRTTIEMRLMNNTEVCRITFYMQMTVKTAGIEVEPMLYLSNYETEGVL